MLKNPGIIRVFEQKKSDTQQFQFLLDSNHEQH
jgi:hypothetical protein